MNGTRLVYDVLPISVMLVPQMEWATTQNVGKAIIRALGDGICYYLHSQVLDVLDTMFGYPAGDLEEEG